MMPIHSPVRLIQSIIVLLGIVLLLVVVAGCGDPSQAKTSLFEHDHEVADHWPSGLADVSVKLRERLDKLDSDADRAAVSEIRDLVGWTAEVAADTDLSEADWIPIHQRTESLSKTLLKSDRWGPEERASIESLCELIDQSVEKIPNHAAMMVGGES